MILQAGCTSTVLAEAPTPVVILLRPQSGEGQEVSQSDLVVSPAGQSTEFRDAFGNICHRVTLQKGESTIESVCMAQVPDEIAVQPEAGYTLIQDLPDDVLQYLMPSRFCQSDLFLKQAHSIAKRHSPGYGQAEAIRHWIQRRVRYKYGVSNESTSAVETLKKRAGVCRDFSHLGIALCRALRIPARIVFGFLHELEPMDLHAWFEAYVGGRWYTFDATQKKPRGNRIVVAYGRDAGDVAQVTNFGPLKVKHQSVWVRPA